MKFIKYFFFLAAIAFVAFTGDVMGGAMIATGGVVWPWGEADVQTPAYAATLAVTITDHMTFLQPAVMTGAMTINLTITSGVRKGARLHMKLLSDGTARAVTLGTGFTGTAIAGTISKGNSIEFVYDGTAFHAAGAPVLYN